MKATTQRKRKAGPRCIDGLGRFTIPIEVRSAMGIKEGCKFSCKIRGEEIVLKVSPDICRICYGKALDMNEEFHVCYDCIRRIQAIDIPQC